MFLIVTVNSLGKDYKLLSEMDIALTLVVKCITVATVWGWYISSLTESNSGRCDKIVKETVGMRSMSQWFMNWQSSVCYSPELGSSGGRT